MLVVYDQNILGNNSALVTRTMGLVRLVMTQSGLISRLVKAGAILSVHLKWLQPLQAVRGENKTVNYGSKPPTTGPNFRFIQ